MIVGDSELIAVSERTSRRYKSRKACKHWPKLDSVYSFVWKPLYDSSQALFKTWLQPVANHFVWRKLQKNHPAESLEEHLLNTLSYAPQQEKELQWKEWRAMLYAAIDKLSLHDQRIARLKLREVPNEEIAQELNIKPASVGREWRVIKTKLAQMVADEGQSKDAP